MSSITDKSVMVSLKEMIVNVFPVFSWYIFVRSVGFEDKVNKQQPFIFCLSIFGSILKKGKAISGKPCCSKYAFIVVVFQGSAPIVLEKTGIIFFALDKLFRAISRYSLGSSLGKS